MDPAGRASWRPGVGKLSSEGRGGVGQLREQRAQRPRGRTMCGAICDVGPPLFQMADLTLRISETLWTLSWGTGRGGTHLGRSSQNLTPNSWRHQAPWGTNILVACAPQHFHVGRPSLAYRAIVITPSFLWTLLHQLGIHISSLQ